MVCEVGQLASFQVDHAHYFYKVAYGVEKGDCFCPLGHAVYGGEEAAHKGKYNDEEKGGEHGLLLIGRDGRDGKPKAGKGYEVYGGKEVNGGEASCGYQAVYDPGYQSSECK